jgi:hypothetical protein
MSQMRLQNLKRLNLDALHIHSAAFLIHTTAKRCTSLISGRTLASGYEPRDVHWRGDLDGGECGIK